MSIWNPLDEVSGSHLGIIWLRASLRLVTPKRGGVGWLGVWLLFLNPLSVQKARRTPFPGLKKKLAWIMWCMLYEYFHPPRWEVGLSYSVGLPPRWFYAIPSLWEPESWPVPNLLQATSRGKYVIKICDILLYYTILSFYVYYFCAIFLCEANLNWDSGCFNIVSDGVSRNSF